ncbi:MAG TPA: energy-coupling factor ABC transporter permease [Campylobacterales bacterium]|nr:energy-coupling factor ABC transporter permease [Campylobacterales bacterium]
MHIEPGVVLGAKIVFSYATSAVSMGIAAKLAFDDIKQNGVASLLIKALLATICVFSFFEILPHYPVGVSEVHLILGSTLFLVFGAGAAAIGLALGLLTQGLFFAPFDLPQYGMNVTTLLVPLFMMSMLAKKAIAPNTPYIEVKYSQLLKLSFAYQGGVVVWVGFWALYGRGFGAENLAEISTFGAAYIGVVIAEPLIDLAVLAIAKTIASSMQNSAFVEPKLYRR